MTDYQYCSKCGGRIIFRYVDGELTPIHLDKGCSNDVISYNQDELIKRLKKQFSSKAKIKSLTIPNSKCPVCGANVYYYENEHGSKVFFDELGPPWPLHPCTSGNVKTHFDSSISENEEVPKKWHPFVVEHLFKSKEGGIYIYEWIGTIHRNETSYLTLYSIHSKKQVDIIKRTCYITKISNGHYILSFLSGVNTYRYKEIMLYSAVVFENTKESLLRSVILKPKKQKKDNNEGEVKEEVKKKKVKNTKRRKSGRLVRTSKEKIFKCETCKKLFKSRGKLKKHRCLDKPKAKIKSTKYKAKSIKSEKESIGRYKVDDKYLCLNCKSGFKTKSEYSKHSCI